MCLLSYICMKKLNVLILDVFFIHYVNKQTIFIISLMTLHGLLIQTTAHLNNLWYVKLITLVCKKKVAFSSLKLWKLRNIWYTSGFFYTQLAFVFQIFMLSSKLRTIKFVSMKNQQCKIRSTLIDLNLDELHYGSFIISINRCDGSCNTVEDPFCRTFFPNKIEDVNLKVFNMITGTNETKDTLKTYLIWV